MSAQMPLLYVIVAASNAAQSNCVRVYQSESLCPNRRDQIHVLIFNIRKIFISFSAASAHSPDLTMMMPWRWNYNRNYFRFLGG